MKIQYVNDETKVEYKVKEVMDKLEEKQNKKFSPEYYDMQAKYKHELKNIAVNAGPWEFSYILDFLVTYIRWMRDYYKNGEGVWGIEQRDEDPKRYKNVPTRLETLEKALAYYDKWQSLEDEYIKLVPNKDGFKSEDNGDGTSTIINLGYDVIYKYGPKGKSEKAHRRAARITYKKLHKAQEKYKKLFFNTVRKYIESWWD